METTLIEWFNSYEYSTPLFVFAIASGVLAGLILSVYWSGGDDDWF